MKDQSNINFHRNRSQTPSKNSKTYKEEEKTKEKTNLDKKVSFPDKMKFSKGFYKKFSKLNIFGFWKIIDLEFCL